MCCSPAKMMHPEVLLEEARTCVQVSAMLAQNELLLCLLDHHADINSAPGTLGWSALHLCALVNNEEGAEKLLAHGAAICHWCCFQTGIFDVSNGMRNWLLLFWLRVRLNSKFRIKGKLTVNPHSSIGKKKSLVLHFHPKQLSQRVIKSHPKPPQFSEKNCPRWRCGGEHRQNVGGTCRASRLSGAAEGSLCGPSRSEGPTATLGSSRGGGGAGGCPRGALGVFQRWVGGKISRKICGFMLFHIFCRKRSVKSGWLSPVHFKGMFQKYETCPPKKYYNMLFNTNKVLSCWCHKFDQYSCRFRPF